MFSYNERNELTSISAPGLTIAYEFSSSAQLMIGTAMENRLAIAQGNLSVYDGDGNRVYDHGFVGNTLKEIVLRRQKTIRERYSYGSPV